MSTPAPRKKIGAFDRRGSGGFRILGIDLQTFIKAFFGGNAAIAVIVIALICFFLAREAYQFFPDYQKSLGIYRKSGQEFVTIIEDEATAQKDISSLATQAYYYEIYYRNRDSLLITETYSHLRNAARMAAKGPLELRKRAEESRDSIAAEIKPEIKTKAEAEIATQTQRIDEKLSTFFNDFSNGDLPTQLSRISDENLDKTKAAAKESVLALEDVTPEFIAKTKAISEEGKAKAEAELEPFFAGVQQIRTAPEELNLLINKLRSHALATKQIAEAYSNAAERKAAYEEGAKNATSEERRNRQAIESARVLTTEPNYAERNQLLYDSIEKHKALAQTMLDLTKEGVAKLDVSMLTDKAAINRVELIQKKMIAFPEMLDTSASTLRSWNHDEPYSFWKAFFGFFFGNKWVTNSSWQDFYGLAPLFSGSLVIALIAITVSVPFAIGAAIYVNQISTTFERTTIKPIIEFIGAIPSIVLGFFGVLVLGDLLLKINNIEWLANALPGFPIDQRLNMLNAGLLLAFMAIPTIFTLAEDALNNVPRAHSEASLALGATRMQTVLKVVFPAAISGVLAAVLLGFGRVIGETMVVLLVAGNRIEVPDFTQGLGVITQPAHTMTGIIAQEMGEVSQGSLHWRALFMVGLVLFLISLGLNYLAQNVIRKFSRHH